jgi:glycosyltransferase involved in cell wall biosynthesis
MKISYCITVWNENLELDRLLKIIYAWKSDTDEVIVQGDAGKVTHEVISVLYPYINRGLQYLEFPLKGDFGAFKTNLFRQSTGDWCFFIDADEYPHENLISCIKELIDSAEYENIELLRVPRINTVSGLTQDWIRKWNWNTSAIDNQICVNWPDLQSRIVKRTESIRWSNKVHEIIDGISSYSNLPLDPHWALYHPKTIDRQIRQNQFYETIQ